MKNNFLFFFLILFLITNPASIAQPENTDVPLKNSTILPGAAQLEAYLPLLKGKSVAVFANQTSIIAGSHLIDALLSSL